MPKRDGPSIKLEISCFDCVHCTSESYRVQSDSGSDVYCIHPDASQGRGNRRFVGDTNWDTPKWCPLRGRTIAEFVESLTY